MSTYFMCGRQTFIPPAQVFSLKVQRSVLSRRRARIHSRHVAAGRGRREQQWDPLISSTCAAAAAAMEQLCGSVLFLFEFYLHVCAFDVFLKSSITKQ